MTDDKSDKNINISRDSFSCPSFGCGNPTLPSGTMVGVRSPLSIFCSKIYSDCYRGCHFFTIVCLC